MDAHLNLKERLIRETKYAEKYSKTFNFIDELMEELEK
jgi:hypothetical protein